MTGLPFALRPALAATMLITIAGTGALAQDAADLPIATYTAAQAEAGSLAYAENCAVCHGSRLNNGQFGPVLRGAPFREIFFDRPAGDLFAYMSTTMPTSAPGSLQHGVYADIMAYIMSENGIDPSEVALPETREDLALVQLVRP